MRPTLLALALTCALAAPATLAQTPAAAPAVPADAPPTDAPAAAPADADPAIACEALADEADRLACEAAGPTPSDTAVPAATDTTAPVDPGAATDGSDAPGAAEEASGTGAAASQAEADFNALYGNGEPYDPVADPTLPPEATSPASYDPWERWNRRAHAVNDVIDRRVAKPLATTYMKVVPRPVRLGVSNFFNNLGQPVSALNALLQGKPKQAGQSAGRFLLNSTLGIGGIFDPATDAKLPRKSEDFGQTLGVWGWKTSRYVELPLFGPRTVRDVVGLAGDSPLSPLRQVQADALRIPLQGLQLVDLRTKLMSTDALREGVEDDYALVRDAWLQRRNYQIFGDRTEQSSDTALPDYLQDDTTPVIPVDAMPVIPQG